jgi:hypothetical protein
MLAAGVLFYVFKIAANVPQLPEDGDFKAIHFQPSTNFNRSTKLDLPLNRHFWVGGC